MLRSRVVRGCGAIALLVLCLMMMGGVARAGVIVVGQTASFSGDTTGGPTFNRPDANGGAPPTSLSSTGTAVRYRVQSVGITVAGDYTFRSTTTSYDNYTFLYSSFDPAAPLANCLIGNDDLSNSSTISGFTITLAAGTHKFVNTSFHNIDFGPFSSTISGPGPISFADFIVTDATDNPNADGDCTAAGVFDGCTLREAIAFANANVDTSTVDFAPALAGVPITLSTVGDSTLGPSALLITTPIIINGLGGATSANGISITRDGSVANLRLFRVTTAGNLTLRNLTLAGGTAIGGDGEDSFTGGGGGGGGGLGGAILVGDGTNAGGTLTVENCTLAGNSAQGGDGGFGSSGDTLGFGGDPNGGGGLDANGDGNAGGFGGGGAGGFRGDGGVGGFGGGAGGFGFFGGNGGGGAGLGSAILNYGGSVSLLNSTFAGNTAQGGTGAENGSGFGTVLNGYGLLTVNSCTFSGNTADDGGAIFNNGDGAGNVATLVLNNSILANSVNGAATAINDYAAQASAGGTQSSSGTNNIIETGSVLFDNATIGGDPKLGALADNGGPTKTFALLEGSAAINAGSNAAVPTGTTTDQRGTGFARIFGSTVDIGAYEVQNSAPTAIALTPSTIAENQPVGSTVGTLSATDADANDTQTYSFASGEGDTDNDSFTITGTALKTTAVFDFETKSSYSIRIQTSDGKGGTFSQQLTITVSDVAEAPIVTTKAATNVSASGVTLNGTVNPNGISTIARFQLGLTTAYGESISAGGALTGTSAQDISTTIGGRTPRTTYHYRTMATNSVGITYGEDQTFTTPETPSPTVTIDTDTTDETDGETSLREAINFANSNPDDSEITFSATAFAAPRKTITVSGGLPVITTNTTITAPAAGVNVVSTAYGASGLFSITSGTVTLTNLSISSNSAGVYTNGGNTTVQGCTVQGMGSSDVVFVQGGTVTVQNCTIIGNANSAIGNGKSGIVNGFGNVTVQNCTITGNDRGINNMEGTVNLSNSIVVGNTSGNIVGYRLNTDDHNITSGTATDAGLDPNGLQENGGPTQTIALLANSPAINAGDPNFVGTGQTDQRGMGFARVRGGRLDIGAFEVQNLAPVATLPDSITTPQNVAKTVALVGTDADGDTLSYIITALSDNGTLFDGAATATPISVVPYTLTDAQHRVTFRGSTGGGSTSGSSKFRFKVNDGTVDSNIKTVTTTVTDPTAPTIAFTSPTSGAVVNTLTPISGVASDNVGVVRVDLYVQRKSDNKYFNGTSWTAFSPTASRLMTTLATTASGVTWTRTSGLPTGPDLNNGLYALAARAFDAQGNGTSATSLVNVDATLPIVAVTSPVDNAVISERPDIRGFVSDAPGGSGIARVDLLLRRNSDGIYFDGRAFATRTPVFFSTTLAGNSWVRDGALPIVNTQTPSNKLLDGSYTVTARAVDRADNSQTAISNFLVDTKKPFVSITTPATGSTVTSLPSIAGGSRDRDGGSGVVRVDVFLKRDSDGKYWNGESFAPFSAASALTTSFSGTSWNRSGGLPTGSNLTPGAYRIDARSTDRAGNIEFAISSIRVVAGSGAAAVASPVQLSSASAKSDGTIRLTFTGALGASATDAANYVVTNGGATSQVISVQQPSASEAVLTCDAFAIGARVAVNYNLQDTQGRTITGTANVTVK